MKKSLPFLYLLMLMLSIIGCAKDIPNKVKVDPLVKKNPPRETKIVQRFAQPDKFYGLCYGSFKGMENPSCGPEPTVSEIDTDLKKLAKITPRIRIYSCTGVQGQIPQLADKYGLKCSIGCSIGRFNDINNSEIQAMLRVAKQNNVERISVGNEVMLRGDRTEDQMVKLIRKVKSQTNLPVGTFDIWNEWSKYPKLLKEVDFVGVHIYAFYGGVPIQAAAKNVVETYQKVKAQINAQYPNKPVIIGETGWPKAGEAIQQAKPGLEEQKQFVAEFVALAKENQVPYFYFSSFDEDWKVTQEGDYGPNWGLYFLKRDSILNPPVVQSLPFVVYDDFKIGLNHFSPSGWMGDIEFVSLDDRCQTQPHRGKTCLKIDYKILSAGYSNWAGIYWQYPEGNWGDLPGYKIKSVKQVSFWARGKEGGEKCIFKFGGIDSYGKKYSDSMRQPSELPVTLSKEWRKYTIQFQPTDLDSVISGFCWVANATSNSRNITLYLDDIQIE